MQTHVVGKRLLAFHCCILLIFSLFSFLSACSESSLEGVEKPVPEEGSTPAVDDPGSPDTDSSDDTSASSDASDAVEPEPEPEPENLPPLAELVVTPAAGDLPLEIQLMHREAVIRKDKRLGFAGTTMVMEAGILTLVMTLRPRILFGLKVNLNPKWRFRLPRDLRRRPPVR